MRRPKVHDISGVILNFCRFDRSYRELIYRALGELILSEIYICFLLTYPTVKNGLMTMVPLAQPTPRGKFDHGSHNYIYE